MINNYLCCRNLTPNLEYNRGAVIYLMHRDQRIFDNDALTYAYNYALQKETNLYIVFYFPLVQLSGNERQMELIISNIKMLQNQAADLDIPFYFISNDSIENLFELFNNLELGLLVTDFSPLRKKQIFIKSLLANMLSVPIHEYDAHNFIPAWIASDKKEYMARTIRKKLHNKFEKYLEHTTQLLNTKIVRYPHNTNVKLLFNNGKNSKHLIIKPGFEAGMERLSDFIETKLEYYGDKHNDPTIKYSSNLSPYINLGHISPKRVIIEVNNTQKKGKDGFIEQIFVRRELADNFCFYEPNYDNGKSFTNWAKKTLSEHKNDKRDYLYIIEDFENAKTHDIYWNAAQNELLKSGKIHNYMRMYWGKKILEWTANTEEAMKIAIYLNDRYAIDGNDPNGYTGISWCIGGVHDRAWSERDIFGKIRYMNDSGLKRKFEIDKYCQKWLN